MTQTIWPGWSLFKVDDSLTTGSQTSLADENSAAEAFLSKPRQRIDRNIISFNALEVLKREGGTLFVRQREKTEGLTVPTTEKELRSQRAFVKYIEVSCRPDICATVQLIASRKERTTKDQFVSLKKSCRTPQKRFRKET